MNSNDATIKSSQKGFVLKATSLTFTVIQLTSVSLENINQQLKLMAQKTPNFFNATPVLIDLTLVEKLQLTLDISTLAEILKSHRMIPIGVKTSNEAYSSAAKVIGIANLNYSTASHQPSSSATSNACTQTNTNPDTESQTAISSKADQSHEQNRLETMVVDQSVRSGKQIYAKNCDLIINASVSHGAEVLADGNIHVYGTLNGRALAGVQGNTKARIYCKSLNAELIAIAGNYLVNEQIPETYKNLNQLLAIELEGQNLDFKKL